MFIHTSTVSQCWVDFVDHVTSESSPTLHDWIDSTILLSFLFKSFTPSPFHFVFLSSRTLHSIPRSILLFASLLLNSVTLDLHSESVSTLTLRNISWVDSNNFTSFLYHFCHFMIFLYRLYRFHMVSASSQWFPLLLPQLFHIATPLL